MLAEGRYWPVAVVHAPRGLGVQDQESGADTARTITLRLLPPRVFPTAEQASQRASWAAPRLDVPDAWLTHPLVEMPVSQGHVYLVTPKEPLDVSGMMAGQIEMRLDGTARGVETATVVYDPDARGTGPGADAPVDMTVPGHTDESADGASNVVTFGGVRVSVPSGYQADILSVGSDNLSNLYLHQAESAEAAQAQVADRRMIILGVLDDERIEMGRRYLSGRARQDDALTELPRGTWPVTDTYHVFFDRDTISGAPHGFHFIRRTAHGPDQTLMLTIQGGPHLPDDTRSFALEFVNGLVFP